MTGLGDWVMLVFATENSYHDVLATNGHYTVRLKPGRYVLAFRVLNNFTRVICDVEVSTSER
jgi:hypothetical protein